MVAHPDFTVLTLGPAHQRSPLRMSTVPNDGIGDFVRDEERVLQEVRFHVGKPPSLDHACERAGAREHIFFDPEETRAAIVTCGGLSPGINNVVRTLYFELTKNYGVKEVIGIRYGYLGLSDSAAEPPEILTSQRVESIQYDGGTVLGTCRGAHDVKASVDFLVSKRIDVLFCVGGDGTQRGAHEIATEVIRRGLPIAIVGIPKTIDNDIEYCDRSFGFLTAMSEAETVIHRAHTEATGVFNGIGLVKLMGREAGFIAAGATIASGAVNFALIPEVPIALEGSQGLLGKLERRLAARRHAVIVVAEGAGQDLIPDCDVSYDASGNRKLNDIGTFLKQRIIEHFSEKKLPINVRYFDPSYHIRSCPANTADCLLCEEFARHAAHAAMAGKTDLFIGLVNSSFVHIPLAASAGQKKRLDPESEWWISATAITGQDKW